MRQKSNWLFITNYFLMLLSALILNSCQGQVKKEYRENGRMGIGRASMVSAGVLIMNGTDPNIVFDILLKKEL